MIPLESAPIPIEATAAAVLVVSIALSVLWVFSLFR